MKPLIQAIKGEVMRRESDFYITPDEPILALMNNYHIQNVRTFLEPCAGSGAISMKMGGRVIQCEIRDSAEGILENWGKVYIGDFLKMPNFEEVDFIITNPPFSLAKEFIDKCLEYQCPVIMLLRLNFLGSQNRHEWWQDKIPSDLLILSKRPSFTGDGKTDGCEYAWFVWNGIGEGVKVI